MKVSVLINNFNYDSYLGACIDSVLKQDYDGLEIIVVDDGSTDRSREIIASYGAKIAPVLKPNGGQASSFNAGFAASTGDIIMLLDSDDTFLAGKVAAVANIFKKENVGWIFDSVTTKGATEKIAALQAYSLVDKKVAMKRGKFPSLPVPTSGLSFRRDVLAKILPMPVAKDVVLSDNFLKFSAAFLSLGAMVSTPLTFQRIHDTNRYTGTSRKSNLKPRIMIATGLELARKFKDLRHLGFSLVAGGFAEMSGPLGSSWGSMVSTAKSGPFGFASAPRIYFAAQLKRLALALKPRSQVQVSTETET